VANSKRLAATLSKREFAIVSGGTDTHVVLVDLRSKKVTGKAAEQTLERANLTCNKNGIPFDPERPAITSGIRLGTSAGTTRGFGATEFETIGNLIADVLDQQSVHSDDNSAAEQRARESVAELCRNFPIYER
jgi:glycine hydroxymethyltransferase